MLPREHGAYSQMALPLVTAIVIAHASLQSVYVAVAVVCGFLAHEPLLVLLGGRGARARKATGARAAVWFALTSVAMIAAGAVAFHLTPAAVRWSFLVPLIPAAWVGASTFRGQEKRASSEIAVALAFACITMPVCLGAGVARATATSIAFVFASVYVTGVLCVRAIVLGKRGGGNRAASRVTRLALLAIAASSMVALGIAVTGASVPWATLIAVTPGLTTAVALAMRSSPPPLKTVGWSLATTSTAAALILIGTLSRLS
jgi:hypothetical protein